MAGGAPHPLIPEAAPQGDLSINIAKHVLGSLRWHVVLRLGGLDTMRRGNLLTLDHNSVLAQTPSVGNDSRRHGIIS